MSRLVILLISIAVLAVIYSFYLKAGKPISSIHQFKCKSIDGAIIHFTSFKGKKMLIVNTASKCGFTPQFKELEELFLKYKDKEFVIVGFPCNQFGSQDPGTSGEIKEFCTRNYGVTFLMMEKINVKGDSISEIYKWLTSKKENGVINSSVKWNFQKYMIDENGFLVDYVFSFKSPTCRKIVSWIEKKD